MRRLPYLALLVVFLASCAPAEPPTPKLTYPDAAQGRRRRRLPRHEGRRPVPVDGRPRRARRPPTGWRRRTRSPSPTSRSCRCGSASTQRLTELWNYPRVSVPSVEGGQLFYTKNTGLQRQAPLFMRAGLAGAADAGRSIRTSISPDGSLSLAQCEPSPDAKLLAYGLSEGGADWHTIQVRDIDTGKDLSDEVKWMRFSDISWTKDAKGFFYSRYPEPPQGQGARGRAVRAGALLPPRRHAAVARTG